STRRRASTSTCWPRASSTRPRSRAPRCRTLPPSRRCSSRPRRSWRTSPRRPRRCRVAATAAWAAWTS
ncbi:MAG: Heat shock protein 60 family chaperone GroEL, partial [uncultured Nocardioidaceae bacterium]